MVCPLLGQQLAERELVGEKVALGSVPICFFRGGVCFALGLLGGWNFMIMFTDIAAEFDNVSNDSSYMSSANPS